MSPRRRLGDLRRPQILAAAVTVIVERGLADTRIADVARRAGTSPALVLYYFRTKDELLAEALVFADERFYAATARELAGIVRARDRLVRLIELNFATEGAGPDAWREDWILWLDLWSRAPRDPVVARGRQALDRRWRETIAEIVRDGQRQGDFGPVDAEEFALRLAALTDGLAIQLVLGDPSVTPQSAAHICLSSTAAELGFALA
ncbi:MAG TPA: TetR/AcrR family transcriptional regulator [Verrucomicrobiae bacterium]|nr:TetR/AcrR family transcriptional regulator [Verrucomicrobiae bacterium]